MEPKILRLVCFLISPVPLGVPAGYGRLARGVALLSLLEQHVVEHPGDVDVDVVLDALQHAHVALDAVHQLAGLGDLTRLRAVHHHARQGATKPETQKLRLQESYQDEVFCAPPDSKMKEPQSNLTCYSVQ